MHGTRDAGFDAGGFRAVSALNGKGDTPGILHKNPRGDFVLFIVKTLDDFLGFGVGYKAMDLAEPAAQAISFFSLDMTHDQLLSRGFDA
jgi:hypothetical protein